jgi:probable HAF family extracellular repeat protein
VAGVVAGLVAAAGAVLGGAAPAGAVTTYQVIDLGTLGGATASAAGINNAGTAVGSSNTAAGGLHAFTATPGHVVDVGSLGGSGFGTAISPAGIVAGFSTLDATSTAYHPFIRPGTSGAPLDLGLAPGFTSAQATGVNDAGVVSENQSFGVGRNKVTHAFRQSGSTRTELGTLGGTSSSTAGVDAAGQIVGTAALASGEGHAVVWNGTTPTDLGTLGFGSTGNAINSAGQVTGSTGTANFGPTHAFLWTAGQMHDLGALATFTRTNGLALNSSGTVVGQANAVSATVASHAFIATTSSITDLNQLIPGGSGWVLNAATGINDTGEITGYGTIGGEQRAFLLVPASGPTVPAAPVGLTATAGDASATLSWQSVPNANTYNVKRAASTSGTYTTVVTGLSQTTFTEHGLTDAVGVVYVVSATNAAGEGPASNAIFVLPQAPLGPPTGLAASNSTRGQIRLTWAEPHGVSVVQNYVYRATGNGAFTMIAVLTPATSYTDRAVSRGLTYRYRVTAVAVYNNTALESTPSTTVSIAAR